MSLASWWQALAKERTKRVQSRTERTLARQEAAARKAEARYGKRAKPEIVQDTGQVVMPDESGMSWGSYLPVLLIGGLLLANRDKSAK